MTELMEDEGGNDPRGREVPSKASERAVDQLVTMPGRQQPSQKKKKNKVILKKLIIPTIRVITNQVK